MTTTRRLAAVLAADVAGYGALMGVDEEGTLARLTAHRGELVGATMAKKHGRIVKTTGDGMLVEFGRIVVAVRYGEMAEDMGADEHGANNTGVARRH